MKTLTAYTSPISNKNRFLCAGLAVLFCVVLLSACGNSHKNNAIGKLDDLLGSFAAELKKDFPYAETIDCQASKGPKDIYLMCVISEEKAVGELSGLIARLKEFALRDDLFEAMKNTGRYYSEYTSDFHVVITKDAWIYDVFTNYKRDFVWSDEEDALPHTPETDRRLARENGENIGEVHKRLNDMIDSFEAQMKDNFPYVDVIFEEGRGPYDLFDHIFYGTTSKFVFWRCSLSEEKTILELSGLITRLKEFTVRDDVLEALESTGNYDAKSETFNIEISIGTKEKGIYLAETSYARDFVWSELEMGVPRVMKH
jgi:hypothetical protein